MKALMVVFIVCAVIGDALASLVWWAHSAQQTFQLATSIVQLLSVGTLPLAAWAIVSAKRDLVKERRIGHELDTLRALASVAIARGAAHETDSQETASQLRGLLLCMPGNDDLRLTRAAVFADPSKGGLEDFVELCPHASDGDNWMNRGLRLDALVMAEPQTLRSEIQAAIERRVNR